MSSLWRKIRRRLKALKGSKTAAEKITIAGLYEIAGVNSFEFHWPNPDETILIGELLHQQAAEGGHIHRARLLATLLEILADLPKPLAQRLALADPDAVEALIEAAFRQMKQKMSADDPRQHAALPRILAGELR